MTIFVLTHMHPAIETAAIEFEKIFDFLKKEYSALQTGRASAALVEDIVVESYGQRMPLKHVANISLPGPQEIMIDPWDKGQLAAIEKAIRDNQDLKLNPVNSGIAIRLNIPPLTEERRKDIVKVVHQKAENARVSIRQIRHASHDLLKKAEKDGELSEDELKRYEKELQSKVDGSNQTIEEMTKHKEVDVMKV